MHGTQKETIIAKANYISLKECSDFNNTSTLAIQNFDWQ